MTEMLNKLLDEQSVTETVEVKSKKSNYFLRRIGAISALSIAGLGVYESSKAVEHTVDRIITPIDYSTETTAYTVQENEGLDAVVSNVSGINSVDFNLVKEHVLSMPENTEVLSDKVIQLGETFIIPAEVSKH